MIAEEMKLTKKEKEDIGISALLHDIGKIGIDESIIRKQSQLTESEYTSIKEHSLIGYNLVKNIEQLQSILPGILEHHENYDGSGYPQGLKEEDISLMGRIIHVAEAYDTMNIDLPYRQSLGKEEALEVLTKSAGIEFDPEVVQAFTAIQQRQKEEK